MSRTDSDVQESHNEVRGYELNVRTFEKAKKDVATLLAELAYERGMSWSDIAELAGVSVSAVRKWRNGGAATPEKRSALARIAAMLDLLEEKGTIGDPAVWMQMDLPFDEPGFYIRPLDLYLKGHDVALLDIAERRKSVAQVLDEITPGWRQQRSDFEVYADSDGQRSVRLQAAGEQGRAESEEVRWLHEESGLTWEQLGRIFGVSRRTVHLWANGSGMNAANREALHEFVTLVRSVPGTTASERRRSLLVPDASGRRPLDRFRDSRQGEDAINRPALNAAEALDTLVDPAVQES